LSKNRDSGSADILVKHRDLQARALGVSREDYLRTLAYRCAAAARLVNVTDGRSRNASSPADKVDWTKLPIPITASRRRSPTSRR